MTVQTREIDYQIGDQSFKGYLAWDDATAGPRPGVVVVHEWWGHDDYVKTRARQLAGEGFAAFALDMYGDGRVGGNPDEAGELMNAVMGQAGAIEQRFDAAVATLGQQPEADAGNISAIGYCFGGAVVLGMARAGKDLKAVASFHGLLETQTPMQAGAFGGKVAVFNGADDPMVTPEILQAFESEMQAAGADYSVKSYPGVVHGFTNPAATGRGEQYGMPLAYDEAADQDSYSATVALIKGTA
ncbi:MAG: dienelactone hydrolase family protein [Xanthomonadales bacterium]|nr:dienelactone hydrolase family protein [Xanthomonadales bacterium]